MCVQMVAISVVLNETWFSKCYLVENWGSSWTAVKKLRRRTHWKGRHFSNRKPTKKRPCVEAWARERYCTGMTALQCWYYITSCYCDPADTWTQKYPSDSWERPIFDMFAALRYLRPIESKTRDFRAIPNGALTHTPARPSCAAVLRHTRQVHKVRVD